MGGNDASTSIKHALAQKLPGTETPVEDDEPRQQVSIFRLHMKYLPELERIFSPTDKTAVTLSAMEGLEGRFFPLPGETAPPSWLGAVERLLPPDTKLNLIGLHPGGMLYVKCNDEHFALTFGHAWALLKDEWLVARFGIRVALNCIARNQLTELKAEQVFAAWHLSNERAPKPSSVQKFSLESDRDLVHTIEGQPSENIATHLGSKIRGGTSLKANIQFSKLREVLSIVSALEKKTDFQSIWPEIDNLVLLSDASELEALDKKLEETFRNKEKFSELNLVVPAQRNSELPPPFGYVIGRLPAKGKNGRPYVPYLMPSAWQSYLNQQKLPLTVYSAKSTSVHFLDEKQERVFVSNIYDCIGFETSVDEDGSTGDYVLSSGRWYRASSSFIASVNQELMRLAVPDRHPLKPWNSTDDEGVYNSSCTLGSASLYLFDAKIFAMEVGNRSSSSATFWTFKARHFTLSSTWGNRTTLAIYPSR